jgi:hypothetical protein
LRTLLDRWEEVVSDIADIQGETLSMNARGIEANEYEHPVEHEAIIAAVAWMAFVDENGQKVLSYIMHKAPDEVAITCELCEVPTGYRFRAPVLANCRR